MADATAVLGIYNYYVDTLSAIVKILRVFMGIPGGNKEEGRQQWKIGMNQGVLMAVDARFYSCARTCAPTTRNTNRRSPSRNRSPRAIRVIQSFMLLLGNLNAELGRNAKRRNIFAPP